MVPEAFGISIMGPHAFEKAESEQPTLGFAWNGVQTPCRVLGT